jgi:hypothetical protein
VFDLSFYNILGFLTQSEVVFIVNRISKLVKAFLVEVSKILVNI